MTDTVVLDGDIIAYRCAAVNEKRGVLATHKTTAEQVHFDTATAFKEWAGESVDDYSVAPTQQAGPLAHTFHAINAMIDTICKGAKCDNYHVVVSGEDNFRLELPLPTRYKDSRKDSVKPLHLADAKHYLVTKHFAEVSQGVEADDVLVGYMYAGYLKRETGARVVQASLDKDAKHGPGWVYDWVNMQEPQWIDGFGELELILKDTGKRKADKEPVYTKSVKGVGRIWLYYQLVFGDPVDAYKPCELAKAKFGEVGAYDLLKSAKTDKEAVELVANKYKLWYPEPVTYRAWDGKLYTKTWLEIMQMYADCCFMRRWDGDRLDVEKLLNKLGVGTNEADE